MHEFVRAYRHRLSAQHFHFFFSPTGICMASLKYRLQHNFADSELSKMILQT